MKLKKIDWVWNSANSLFKRIFGLWSSRNFGTMGTWRNDFSSLLREEQYRPWAAIMKEVYSKFFPKTFPWSNSTQHRPSLQRNLKMAYSSLQKLQREWVQTFGAANSRIVWVDKRYLLLVDGCLEYHRPIMTNACPPKWSQKSLRTKLVSILPGVYEVGNRKDFSEGKHMKN